MNVPTAGLKLAEFEAPYRDEAVLIAHERANRLEVKGAEYAHSTFANMSFKDAKLVNSSFLNCVFVDCYFRGTELRSTKFVGCQFVDCSFSKVRLSACDFRYVRFRGCHLPFAEIEQNAPPEPNLRMALYGELSRAAESTGDQAESRRYKLAGISATNQHLWAAVKAENSYYQEHFPLNRRVQAAGTLFWHYLNRVLWQHGESALQLFIVGCIGTLLLFPALLKWFGGLGFGDAFWLSLSNFLSIDRLSAVENVTGGARVLSTLEGLSGVLFAGMYVTLLLKALLRR
ncbi:pentapeptide repeat-containing protein [Kribbella sp. NPDC051586]|uniref:pentapeptide repeat-containing protein n=1 Tax=Kribbella sp. NPDC051586 TaxID=3364118 RepID=UPI00379C32AB